MGWFLALSAFFTIVVAQTSIQVSLKPAWNATSLLVEASEYFGRQSADAYWSFVNSVLESPGLLNTDEAEYTLALNIAQKISGPAVAGVLKYSLSIRNYSPTAELYRQLFQQALLRNQALHSTSLTFFDKCEGVVDVGGSLVCVSADNLAAELGNVSLSFSPESFDHVFPSLGGEGSLALYSPLTSPKLSALHHALVAFGSKKGFKYIYRPLVQNSPHTLSLTGFGIELAQKNMEYKVLDDKKIVVEEDENVPSIANLLGTEDEETELGGFFFNRLMQRHPDLKSPLSSFRDELLAAQKDEGKIKAWDMKDLGVQSSQSIMRAKDPLALLRDLSQNFPMYATSLTKLRVNKTIVSAFAARKWDTITRGDAGLIINGIPLSAEDIDIFQLHNFLQQEAQIADELRLLKLPSSVLAQVRAIPRPPTKNGYLPTKDAVRINTAARGEGAVRWINDINTDGRYAVWPRSISDLLQPGWPGQLRYVRKNLYTGITLANPSTVDGLRLFERAYFFVENNAPVRIGMAFVIPSAVSEGAWPETVLPASEWKEFAPESGAKKTEILDNSPPALIAKLFHWLYADSKDTAMGFLKALLQENKDFTTTAEIKHVFKTYYATTDMSENSEGVFEMVMKSQDSESYVDECKLYGSSLGVLSTDSPALFINGMHNAVPASADFRSVLVEAILGEQRYITQLVREGKLNDYTDVYHHFVSAPTALPRLSSHVLASDSSESSLLPYLPKWPLSYFYPADKEFQVKVASYWCVGDFNTLSGLQLASAALAHVSSNSQYNSRVALLHNPAPGSSPHLFARFAEAALSQLPATKALPLVRKAAELCLYLTQQGEKGEKTIKPALLKLISTHPKLKEKVQEALRKAFDNEWKSSLPLTTINIKPGERRIISNGRPIIIPDSSSQLSLLGDFQVMDQYENVQRKGEAVLTLLQDITFTDMNPDDVTAAWVDEVALRIAFQVAKRASFATSSVSSVDIPVFAEDEIGVTRYRSEDSLLRVVAVVDPLSKIAQRLAPFLLMMRDQMQADITLVLNPPEFISSFPLKRFYRHAVPSGLTFNDKGAVVKKSGLLFRNLVTKSTLTLTIDTPEAWMVASAYAPYDLDNLRLSEIQQDNVYVEFDLRHLLLTGQCLDPSSHDPPAGLQLDLASETGKVQADTLVMANLGYFQLQANPGLWYLNLHEAANTIYKVTKGVVPLWGQFESMKVIISAFDEPMRSLPIERRPGQENVKLSDLTMAKSPTPSTKRQKGGGFFSSFFGGGSNDVNTGNEKGVVATGTKEDETIHVFSVASGHLYERFLKIMMLSVVRSTKSPVKFWFIENFFSPQFKEFVPRMAEKYGYQVQFVTYKWPEWLRRQEEKQRVIWGYKILFLDVLFPLDLKKVIYIDADQVVRGDLKELWDMDLNGAPYGYTPFCGSNPDTEGFRFWKQGYWRDQLRGRPYHISALYVVDLIVFRKLRAGDSLRMVYDNLSQDPNSLANLDQDLPNYAQSMVPIFSLPQEWLWCQTWCSMETLSTAKTIDLCNNPLTKRPKLEVAKELLPEWETLDNEASALTHTFVSRNTTHEDL